MRKPRTRLLALLLSFLLLFGTFAAALAETKKDLSLSLFTGGYEGVWNEIIPQFEAAYPEYNLITDIDSLNHERLRVNLIAGTPPDCALPNMGEFTLFEAAQSGQFQDLTPLFDSPVIGDESGRTYRDLFTPSDLDMITVNGEIRVAPSDTGFEAWWYNKALFREKGWEVPKTWDEFLTLCGKIKAEGIAPLAYQGLYPTYMIWGYLLQAIAAYGGRQAYVDCMYLGAEDPWHSEAVRQAVQNLYDLSEKGYILDGTTALNHTEAQMEFLNGRVAFIPCGTWLENEMANSIPEGFELGFCPVPVADADGNNYVCKYQSYFAVPTDAKNPEGGMNFIKFIYSEAGQVAYAHAGMISYLKDISESAKACYSPVLQDAIATANGEGVAFVENLGEVLYRSLYDVIDDNLTLIVLRQITVDQFCDNVQAQYESLRNDPSVIKIAIH